MEARWSWLKLLSSRIVNKEFYKWFNKEQGSEQISAKETDYFLVHVFIVCREGHQRSLNRWDILHDFYEKFESTTQEQKREKVIPKL